MHNIRKGDSVRLLPEWQDIGDDKLNWIAIEDADGGRVRIMPIDSGLNIPPHYVVHVDMLEAP